MKNAKKPGPKKLDQLIEEITTDAYGQGEQLWAFRQAFENEVDVPCDAELLGEPVEVLKFDFDGNERRGLTAVCRRPGGPRHIIAASELSIPRNSTAALYLAAYRRWMGLSPSPAAASASQPEGPVELVVLSVKRTAAACRLLGDGRPLTYRMKSARGLVPGEIAVVKPAKHWTYAGNLYLSGSVESTRFDAAALGLEPLRLEARGTWDPAQHYWGEKGEPLEPWAKPIAARGPRPAFEMEQILPGCDPEDPFSDPVIEASDLFASGDGAAARAILMDLCQADLRCLDAHAHLGNHCFDALPKEAILHYEAGFRIGALSLPDSFDGLLPWGFIDNRPFLRCMHGFGLCLWRLGRPREARAVLDKMLWMNPSDNQGVRMLIGRVRKGLPWDPDLDG